MKISEWLGSLILIVALMEFIPNPRKAIESIPGVLQTNVRMSGNHLMLRRDRPKYPKKAIDPKL